MNKEGGLGGKGESGMGHMRGRASFDTFTHRKIVGIQPANFDVRLKYPPIPPEVSCSMLLLVSVQRATNIFFKSMGPPSSAAERKYTNQATYSLDRLDGEF